MNKQLQREITFFSVFKYVLPTIAMMVILSLYTVVDGVFVSRLIGTDAFSAVNIVYPLLSLVIGLGTMFGSGITSIVSMKLGANKQEEANRNFTFIITISILIGIVLSIVSYIFLDKIVVLLGANQKIYDYSFAYAMSLMFFFFAYILQFQFQSIYIANGKPHLGLILTIIGGIANVILDYVFIAVFDMGIAGAGVATGVGCTIPVIFGLLYFTFVRSGSIYFVKPKFDLQVLVHTMSNGSSEMVSYLSSSVTTFLFNIILMKLVGQDGVAAIAAILYIDFIVIAIVMGFSVGVSPLFSFNLGANQQDKIRKLYKISIRFCLCFGVGMSIVAIGFAKPLSSIFSGEGTAVFNLAYQGLIIYALGYVFKSINVFASAMFTAFGNGKVSALLAFLRTLVFLVSSLFFLAALFQVNGVWWATPIAEMLAFLFACYFLYRYRYQYHYHKKETHK